MAIASFPDYRRACGWLEPGVVQPVRPALSGLQAFDVVIVGAGFTGLSIALQLARLRPQDQIAVLEAEQVGTGSPGRNSGFALETVLKATSNAAATALAGYYRAAHDDLQRFGGPQPGRSATIFKAAASERGVQGLKKMQRFLQASQQQEQWLDADQIRSLTGSRYYRAGLQLAGNQLLNPAALIRSVAAQLPANITLFEHSPVLAVQQGGSGWQVQTATGTALAPKLMLANNAFIKGLGVGASRSVTIFTYAGVTAPLPDRERQQVMAQGPWGLLPAHRLGSTFRTTDDGRLLVRGMYGYEQEGGDEVARVLLTSLKKRYPELPQAQSLERWWGGTTSLTANGAPIWGQLAPGLYVSAGCNGVGIVKGWFLGQQLARLACNENTADITALYGKARWMPPEPLRKLGFLAVSSLEKQLAGAEI